MRAVLSAVCLLTACATVVLGPKPVPPSATAAQRAALLDQTLANVDRFSVTITSDATNASAPVALNATLSMNGPNVTLTTEGALGSNHINAELRVQGEMTSRTVSARATATSNQGPTPPGLKRAVTQGLVRFGLKGLVTRLLAEQLPAHAEADLAKAVALENPSVVGAEVVGKTPCTRLSYAIGSDSISVCVADATGLPLDRKAGAGDDTLTETYTWAGTP